MNLVAGEPGLSKMMFERLQDVMTVKLQITYIGEQFKEGIFDCKIEYTFNHTDDSEEIGTIQATGTGNRLTLEAISKNEFVLPTFVFQPLKIEAAFQPNKEFKFLYTQTNSTIDVTFTFESFRHFKLQSIYKHLENEDVYTFEVAKRDLTLVHTMGGTELTNLNIYFKGDFETPIKFIVFLKGNVEASPWFVAGSVDPYFGLNLSRQKMAFLNHVFNNKEIMKIDVDLKKNPLKAKINFDNLKEYKGSASIDLDPEQKSLMIKTNIDTVENIIRVEPLDDMFRLVWNSEVLAELVIADRKVELMRPFKDGEILKTTITWTGQGLLENTVKILLLSCSKIFPKQ